MKAHQQLIITMNNKLNGYQQNESQVLQWLQNVTPVIVKKQKMVTDELYLAVFKNSVSFCLS
jgi:hypothetical protein